MAFTIKNESPYKKEVEFEVGLGELESYIDEAVDDLRERIELDGFRKGKAPKKLIKQRFHDELRDVAIERLIKKAYQELLSQKKWQPAAEAAVRDIKTEGKISFTVEIETVPEFDLAAYTGIDLVRQKQIIDDQMVSQRIDELRERYAELVPTARPAQIDDVLTIDYEVREGEQTIESKQKIMIEIGDRRNNEDLNRALVGMKKDENKDFMITVEERMLAYKVKVWEVKEKQRPLLSDEFARDLKCTDLNDLKKKVEETLQKEAESASRDELLEQASQYLIERHKFEVPESLVREEYQRMLERQGLTDSPEHWERFRKLGADRVRLQFVLNRIAQQEKIEATNEEIEGMIRVQAALLGTDFDELRTRVEGSEARERLADIIRREKALNLILEKANIIEKGLIKSPWEAK